MRDLLNIMNAHYVIAHTHTRLSLEERTIPVKSYVSFFNETNHIFLVSNWEI